MSETGLTPIPGNHSAPDKYRDRTATLAKTGLDKILAVLEQHDAGQPVSAICQAQHMDHRTVGAIIRQYRDRVTSARQLLNQSAVAAVHAWNTAIPIAAARGNHQPAKDLLAHVGAVDNPWGRPAQASSTNVAVQVVIGTPDSPIPHDPVTASGFALSTVPNPKPIK